MTTDFALRLGNTLMGAVTPPAAYRPAARPAAPSLWRRLAHALFQAPGRVLASLGRRQAERDALVRYYMTEGRRLGLRRTEIEHAVLLTGRADMLFPSYFVDARHDY